MELEKVTEPLTVQSVCNQYLICSVLGSLPSPGSQRLLEKYQHNSDCRIQFEILFLFFPTDVEIPKLKKIMSIPLGCYCYLTDRSNKFQTQFLLIRTEFRFYLNSAIMSKQNLYYWIKFHSSRERIFPKILLSVVSSNVVFNLNGKI